MLSRLEGFGAGAAGGGDVNLFWSLFEPIFRSLVPSCVNERVLLDLAVGDSVGIGGTGGELSLHMGGCAVMPRAEEGGVGICRGVVSELGVKFGTGGS